jgi:hypothetical protein
MDATSQATILDCRGAAPAARDDVVDLEAQGGAADTSGIDRPLALSFIPRPDGALHHGGNVAGVLGGPGVLLRLLHFSTALGLLGQQEVERRLDDLLGRGARLRMALAFSSGVELVDELLRHGHMEALQAGGEWFQLHRRCLRRSWTRRPGNDVARRQFNRLNAS